MPSLLPVIELLVVLASGVFSVYLLGRWVRS
jgi:hypothetical protein